MKTTTDATDTLQKPMENVTDRKRRRTRDLTVMYNQGTGKVIITGGDDGKGKLIVNEETAIVFDKSSGGGDFTFSKVIISTEPIECPRPTSLPPIPDDFTVYFPAGTNEGKLVITDADTAVSEITYHYAVGVTPEGSTEIVWSDPQIVNRPQ